MVYSPVTEETADSLPVKEKTTSKASSSSSSSTSSSSSSTCDNDLDLDFDPSKEKERKSDHELEDQESPKKGYKRKRVPDKWERNVLKELRNSGQEFVSPKSSRIAKHVKGLCNDKCKFMCKTIKDDDRKSIFDTYWGLADVEKKRIFLKNLMKPINSEKPKLRKIDENGNIIDPRGNNNAYYLNVGETSHRVCKLFFMNTFDISDRVIRTVIMKTTNVPSGLAIIPDQRGKHKNQKKLPVENKERLVSFINAIPRIPSHYLRAQTKREFIDGGKTIAELHRDYVEECKKEDVPHASYSCFYDIFKKEFNISFFTPKKDQCELCIIYENANPDEKCQLKDKYDLHKKQKELSRLEMKADSEDPNIVNAIFDLQAVVQLPKGEVSSFYYVSKLNAFNLSFINPNASEKLGHCFVWDESMAHRGANEIGSCVFYYLTERCKLKPGADVVLYSDNCAGQQKNQFLVALYVFLVHFQQETDIASITHKFLIRGHTQNVCDSMHSVIEKKITRSLKSGPMFTTDSFVSAIQHAKTTGEPYHVTEMEFDQFFNLKALVKDMGMSLTTIRISEAVALKIEKKSPRSIFVKYSYSDEWEEATLFKKKIPTIDSIQMKKAFDERPGLNKKKKEGLMKLVEKGTIPKKYRSYYESL